MSSATPMTSSVREVLLKTSAPTGRRDRTTRLASSPESTTLTVIPLRSSALATERICCPDASRENSARASSLGPFTDEPPDRSVVGGAPISLAADFSEALVDQGNRHRPLAYRSCAAFDRAASDVARGEQSGQVRQVESWVTRHRPWVRRPSR